MRGQSIVSREMCGCSKLTITYTFKDANGRKFRRVQAWNRPDATAEIEHEPQCAFNDDPPGPQGDPCKPCYLTKPDYRPDPAPELLPAPAVIPRKIKPVKKEIVSLDLFGRKS